MVFLQACGSSSFVSGGARQVRSGEIPWRLTGLGNGACQPWLETPTPESGGPWEALCCQEPGKTHQRPVLYPEAEEPWAERQGRPGRSRSRGTLCSLPFSLHDQLSNAHCHGGTACQGQDLHLQEADSLPELDWRAHSG